MNEETRKRLLEDQQVIVLPEEITHAVYEDVLAATLMFPGKEITLYCRGEGGESRAALAIVDLIRLHGKFVGILCGAGNSAHGMIWAACQTRVVTQHGALGIHMVSWDSYSTRVDAKSAAVIESNFRHTNDHCARIYAEASNRDERYWLEQLERTSGSVVTFTADDLVEFEMAVPVKQYIEERFRMFKLRELLHGKET